MVRAIEDLDVQVYIRFCNEPGLHSSAQYLPPSACDVRHREKLVLAKLGQIRASRTGCADSLLKLVNAKFTEAGCPKLSLLGGATNTFGVELHPPLRLCRRRGCAAGQAARTARLT